MRSLTLVFSMLLASVSLFAQENQEATEIMHRQQVAVSAGASITRKTTMDGVKFEPTSAGAYEISYRYRLLPHISLQGDYDLILNTQKYLAGGTLTAISSNVHTVTANAVINFGNPFSKRIEAFVSLGGGALIYELRTRSYLGNQAVGQFSIGGGDDFLLSRNLRIRAQVKGMVYKAPDFGLASIHTDKFVQTVIPTLGIVYSFK